MAILHRATIRPTKLELLEAWLDRQPWGGIGELAQVGSYRFDDPEGEVGVEAILVRRGDTLLHVPMTYRGAPLDGADAFLIGTMEHSVLGSRWVYAAEGDQVAVGCYTRALEGHQEQAALEVYDGEQLVDQREPDVVLRREPGEAPAEALRLVHTLGEGPDGSSRLVASWGGGEAVVAVI